MKAGDICLQCSKDLQRDPLSRAEKEGKMRYQIRDVLISPLEDRCMRCHCRLGRAQNNFGGALRIVVGGIGMMSWGCEVVYGGVRDKLVSSSDRQQGSQNRNESVLQ